jgi:carboxymethylenebutenolidase
MERKKASDFPPGVLELFHRYIHGELDRAAFLRGAQRFAVGGATAAGFLAALTPNYAWAQQVAADDRRIRTQKVAIPSPQGNGTVNGYLVTPADGKAPFPSVVVIHENRGRTPYIEDVSRRLGVAGYVALAPDGLTTVGGFTGDDERSAQLFAQMDRAKMSQDFLAAAQWLRAQSSTGKIGAIGFCFGGGQAFLLATRMPEIAAAVGFYGSPPPAADIGKIRGAILDHVPELDPNLLASWPAYDAALTAAHVVHAGYVYPKAYHGFHNDTTPRYDDAASKLAWQRTLDWYARYLRSSS